MEYLSECSPQQLFPADFLSIPPSPYAYPQSPPTLRHATSDFFASSMRQTASLPSTSLKDSKVNIEPFSAVAIFALLALYPEGTLIGITEQATFQLHPRDTWTGWLASAFGRYLNSQNGDQLTHLIEPIREACNLYGTSNPHITTIFLLAQKGIEKLEKHYVSRSLIIKTINTIKTIFDSHVQSSLRTQSNSSIMTSHFAYPTATTSYQTLPTTAMPSATPPTLIPTPSPQTARYLCWKPKDLEDFAEALLDISSNSEATPEERTLYLSFRLQKINEKQVLQRSLEMFGRSV
jgi:hypothetical protein